MARQMSKKDPTLPRFWRTGNTIYDYDNDHAEIGHWMDIAAEVLELREENAKLRDDYAGLQSWCKAVEERLQADINQQSEDMAEIERLRNVIQRMGNACRSAYRILNGTVSTASMAALSAVREAMELAQLSEERLFEESKETNPDDCSRA